jgi:hypothetical protein
VISFRTFAIELVFALASSTANVAAMSQPSPCAIQLPAGVRGAVHRAFPGYRLVDAGDSDAALIDENRLAGGPGCVSVTSGRFVVGRSTAFAMLLLREADSVPTLVVAVPSAKTWQIVKLRDFPNVAIRDMYVGTLKPNRYDRTGSADGDLEPGEVRTVRARAPSVAVGISDSSELGFSLSLADGSMSGSPTDQSIRGRMNVR